MSTTNRHRSSRQRFLGALGLSGLVLSSSFDLPASAASGHAPGQRVSPSEGLQLLLQGNERYVLGTSVHCNNHFARRAELAGYQHPFAMVLGCADSRVPPEIVFDQGLGDIFTVRVAGNIADANAIGSFEYAVLHFAPSVLVVLGHDSCGAVSATIDAVKTNSTAPSHIASIVNALKPAVDAALHEPGDTLRNAINTNVKDVAHALKASSSVIAEAALPVSCTSWARVMRSRPAA